MDEPRMAEPHAQEPSADVLGYLAGLRRYWLIGLIVFVLVAALGIGWARTSSVTYQATVQVLVQPGDVDTDAQAVQQQAMIEYLMRSYTATDDNQVVVDQVATELQLSPAQVAAATSITWAGDSLLLEIRATGSSAQAATSLATTYAAALVAHDSELLPAPSTAFDPQLAVVDGPVSAVASSATPGRRTVMALFVAFVVAIASMALADGVATARRRSR